ncbi:MAG: hypothetical protein R3345_10355, partial [Fulvivirga sp.]|nr:hypothetical protein [Fulvivirga sp.]
MKFLFPAFIFLLMLSITPSAYAQKSDAIQVIRERLFYQDFDQARSFEFHDYIVSLKDSSSTVKAYQAAAAALVAKHAWNPI